MTVALRVVEFLVGAALVVVIIDAAIRTFVLPRPAGVTLSRAVARAIRSVFDLIANRFATYEGRDRVMALYGPVTLLTFPVVWLIGVGAGYALMFHAVSDISWRESIRLSGSALFTLGFAVPETAALIVLDFSEAAVGLVLIALLIAYLPTMYSAFSHREATVSRLTVRAGTPPRAADLLIRAHLAGFTQSLDDVWREWEVWFVEVEESHTSLAMLNFFRSTNPHRSWLTSAGTILDAAALRLSTLQIPYTAHAAVCIRAGYTTLRSIADFFDLTYDPDPQPTDPISITREEFIEVYEELAGAGVPVIADRDKAWRDFAGWRVNYDTVLVKLAGVIMAPYAQWISDRSILQPDGSRLRALRRSRPARSIPE